MPTPFLFMFKKHLAKLTLHLISASSVCNDYEETDEWQYK